MKPPSYGRHIVAPSPGSEYRQIGWHCQYHEQAGTTCHNPLDCDFVPIWVVTITESHKHTWKKGR